MPCDNNEGSGRDDDFVERWERTMVRVRRLVKATFFVWDAVPVEVRVVALWRIGQLSAGDPGLLTILLGR